MAATLPLPIWPAFNSADASPFFLTAAKLFNAWMRRKVTIPFAVAMVTQADMESAFKPKAVGDKGEAYNLYQWHWTRGQIILDKTGIDIRTETNIERIVAAAWWELQNDEKKAYAAILACSNAADASRMACKYFEGAGAPNAAERRAAEGERWSAWIEINLDWVRRQG